MPWKHPEEHREQLKAASKRYEENHRKERVKKSQRYRQSHLEERKAYEKAHRARLPNAYRSWMAMRNRCNNPNAMDRAMYGAKGIKVCDRWDSFENFFADMGERPFNWDLHRKDSSQDYCKSNCVWMPKTEHSKITMRGRWSKRSQTRRASK